MLHTLNKILIVPTLLELIMHSFHPSSNHNIIMKCWNIHLFILVIVRSKILFSSFEFFEMYKLYWEDIQEIRSLQSIIIVRNWQNTCAITVIISCSYNANKQQDFIVLLKPYNHMKKRRKRMQIKLTQLTIVERVNVTISRADWMYVFK